MQILILPGAGGSGPQHWQSLWQQAHPELRRVEQRDWVYANCDEWVAQLELAVAATGPDCVLVAHSLACLLVAHWAALSQLSVQAALLVAPPDPAGPLFPHIALGFTPLPLKTLPFASHVIASNNDPFGSVAFAADCAAAWGSSFCTIGAAGHINVDSGFGQWEAGWQHLEALLAQAG